MRSRKLWWLGVIVALGACAPQEQAPPVDIEAEAQAVRAVSQQWYEHVVNRDLESLVGLFADDAVFFDHGEEPKEGLAAIRADIEGGWAENPDFTVSWSTLSVDVSESGDLAWERGVWNYDADGPGAAEPTEGEYVTIYRKVDGAWKAVADIGVSTEPQGAATMTEPPVME